MRFSAPNPATLPTLFTEQRGAGSIPENPWALMRQAEALHSARSGGAGCPKGEVPAARTRLQGAVIAAPRRHVVITGRSTS